MQTYLILEKSQFLGEVARFSDKKEAIKYMLKYNLNIATYNQQANKMKKYSFPLVRVHIMYIFKRIG